MSARERYGVAASCWGARARGEMEEARRYGAAQRAVTNTGKPGHDKTMSPLDLQYFIRSLWIFFSSVIVLQLIGILVARANNGESLRRDISNVPLKFEDTSPILCIQKKGSFPISSSITILVLLLLSINAAGLTTPTGLKHTIHFIALLAISLLASYNMLIYRNSFSILTENSIYINNICTLFRTVRIPIEHITKHEAQIIHGTGFFTFYVLIISTHDRPYTIRQITNWKCFIDALDKLKAN